MTMTIYETQMKTKYMVGKAARLFLLIAAGLAAQVAVAQQAPSADQVVNALEKQNGVVPGERRSHIIGICISGTFVGNTDAQVYSKSALFSGQPLPGIGRFSLAGGNPKTPDTAKNPRGLALQFQLPGEKLQHFTMLNVPIFGAANPTTFYDSVVANTADPATGKPDPDKQKAFRESHPDAAPLAAYLSKNNPPASYVTSDFFSVHTFKFVNSKNETSLVKWQFIPEAGVTRLTDDELTSKPAKFLDQDLINRLAQGSVKWNMVLTIGEKGDEENNPTVYWPAERKKVQAGVLTISKVDAQKGANCEKINFDPLVMSDGILPTADPILNFRSPAYAASFVKRLTAN